MFYQAKPIISIKNITFTKQNQSFLSKTFVLLSKTTHFVKNAINLQKTQKTKKNKKTKATNRIRGGPGERALGFYLWLWFFGFFWFFEGLLHF